MNPRGIFIVAQGVDELKAPRVETNTKKSLMSLGLPFLLRLSRAHLLRASWSSSLLADNVHAGVDTCPAFLLGRARGTAVRPLRRGSAVLYLYCSGF